ncbi:hypothetical protein FHS57_000975 [Runella defluvii]|uniref:Uncharacterized protein n=1 Tax=Runella defluvii TaxID=370973 RepID=A0A7W5ZHL1_9BACT|nr:hypothetical protein [Runella defluvii]
MNRSDFTSPNVLMLNQCIEDSKHVDYKLNSSIVWKRQMHVNEIIFQ